jgi:hypothetical protein
MYFFFFFIIIYYYYIYIFVLLSLLLWVLLFPTNSVPGTGTVPPPWYRTWY